MSLPVTPVASDSAAGSPSSLSVPLARRLPRAFWIAVSLAFLAGYGLMFSVVHVLVDTRACLVRLPDPFLDVIPHQPAFTFVTHGLYYLGTLIGTVSLSRRAARGDHLPFAQWGLGLTLQAFFRCATLALVPLCHVSQLPGTSFLHQPPLVNLGFVQIPWRLWAENDLMFSGHVGEFLLLSFATGHWPKPARNSLIAFQLLQAYALLATREHYTIDLLVAVPFAYLANGLARRAVTWVASRRTLLTPGRA